MLPENRSAARKAMLLMAKVPGVRFAAYFPRLVAALVRHKSLRTLLFAPPGDFYSPLPDVRYVEKHAAEIFDPSKPVAGLDLREEAQVSLLGEFAKFHDEFPFPRDPEPGFRYYCANRLFETQDAMILYCFLRHFRPKRVIEVGSGFSSAVMLDVNERFLDGTAHLTFIEPYPKRLLQLARPGDLSRHPLVEKPVQEVPIDAFRELDENDILFIDSSHVVKVGSDVQYLMFQALPALKPGVIIHFHDIAWPFEYPPSYVLWGRAWNETYLVRAFLMGNRDYEVLFFNHFMMERHAPEMLRELPRSMERPGGGLWLRKTGPSCLET